MKTPIFAFAFSVSVLLFVTVKGLVSCSRQVEPQPEIIPQDSLIAADSVDTPLLIRTNKKDSTDN